MISSLTPILVLALAIWLWTVLRRRFHDQRARGELLELAPRIGARERLEGGRILRFERRGFPAAVSIHFGARHNIEIAFRLRGEAPGWLSVASLGIKHSIFEQFGALDLQVGDPEFDERLEVWGSDERWTRSRLRPEIRGLLLQADRRWDFLFRLTPEQLSLRARVRPIDRFQIETLTGIAFQILDLLELTSPADFVLSNVQVSLDIGTRCPVCGTPLSRGRIVRCSKCGAVHHADCWQFNGLCATFACGSSVQARS
jgi:hypothetical protein